MGLLWRYPNSHLSSTKRVITPPASHSHTSQPPSHFHSFFYFNQIETDVVERISVEEAVRAWELSLSGMVASEWGYPFTESKHIPKGCRIQLGCNCLLPNPQYPKTCSLFLNLTLSHPENVSNCFHIWSNTQLTFLTERTFSFPLL